MKHEAAGEEGGVAQRGAATGPHLIECDESVPVDVEVLGHALELGLELCLFCGLLGLAPPQLLAVGLVRVPARAGLLNESAALGRDQVAVLRSTCGEPIEHGHQNGASSTSSPHQ